jgi:uncharacterized protein YoxC
MALEITLIASILLLVGFLVPLLYQLRRTADGIDQFLLATRKDLSQITEDVHASRLRIDHLAAALQLSLCEFSLFSKSVSELGCKVKELHHSFRSSLESASRNVGGVLGGISAVLAFFKSKSSQPECPKDADHE